MKINQKLTSGFIGFTLLIGIVLLMVFHHQNKSIEKYVLNENSKVEKTFQEIKKQEEKTLSCALEVFTQNQAFKDMFLEKNKDKLYNYGQPLFQILKQKYGITHFYFILPDEHCFIRLHNRKVFGDLISRFTFYKARDTKKTASGIELGKTAFALRTVVPYYNNNELIGYVEFGEEIDHFLEILKGDTDNEFILIADKKYLDRKKWKSVKQVAELRDNWDDLKYHVIVGETSKGKMEEIKTKCFKEENLELMRSQTFLRKIESEEKTFAFSSFEIIDAGGRNAGALLCLIDITEQMRFLQKSYSVTLIIAIISLIITLAIGLVISQSIINPIRKLKNAIAEVSRGNLGVKVEIKSKDEIRELADYFNKMTKDLMKTMDDLNKEIIKHEQAERNLNKKTLELSKAQKASLNIMEDIANENSIRKKAEEHLIRERNFSKSIIETAQTIMLLLDIEGKIVSFNPYMEEICGYRLEEVKGKDWFEKFIPQRDQQKIRELFKNAVNDIQTRGNVNPIVTKDGNERNIEWYDKTLKDADGNITGILSIGQDITEREEAENKIRTLNQRIEYILGTTKTGLDIIDSNFNMIYIDPEWQKAYGDPTDKKCYEYFMDRTEICPDCGVVKALETKSVIVTEEILVKENNRPVQVTTIPFQDDSGEWLVAEVNVDITERKQMEKNLKQHAHNLGERVKEISCLYGISRLDFDAGSSMEDILQGTIALIPSGWQYPEITCCKIVFNDKEFKSADFKETQWKQSADIKANGKKIGTIEVVYLQEKPQIDEGPFLKEERDLIETIADKLAKIAERKKAEKRIKHQSEFLNTILESLTHPFYIIDTSDYTIKLANSAAHLGKFSKDSTCHALTHKLNQPCSGEYICPLDEVKRTKKPVTVEHIHRDKDGNNKHVEVHGYPIFDNQGNVIQMIEYSLDISDRKKAEYAQKVLNEQLKAVVDKLTIANEELTEFAYIAAHDLKAPLRAIGCLAGIISSDYTNKLDDQGKDMLNTMVMRTQRMNNLISSILHYSEIGRTQEQKEMFDLNLAVTEAIDNINLPDNIGITTVNQLPTIMCDKIRIIQVFQNLLDNAVKYMDKPNGQIKIDCSEEIDYWKLSVSDNGSGIAPKYHEKIFKIFQTLVSRDEIEATGIGLSIVKKIVESHGGKIWVESKPDRGTTFLFTLAKQEAEVNYEQLKTNIIS